MIWLFLLLIAFLAATAASVWTLATDGPGAGFLRAHLPLPVIGWLYRLAGWFDAGDSPPAAPAKPTRPATAPAAPVPPRLPPAPLPSAPAPAFVPVPANGGTTVLTPSFAAVVAEIAGHEPEDDADLIGFMQHAAAFEGAQADAWRSFLDHCLHEIGLDPASVQGVAEYADVKGDTAADAAAMMAQFTAVYQQVRDWLASGGTLPHDGKFLTGEGGA